MTNTGEREFIPDPELPVKPKELITEFEEPEADLEWEDWDGEEKPALPVELREDLE